MTRVAFALCAIVLAAACSSDAANPTPPPTPRRADSNGADAGTFSVLLFSRTAAFRHDSIPDAIAALTELGSANGYTVEATEDPAMFTAANLARFRVVVFLMTTGDVLDAPARPPSKRGSRAAATTSASTPRPTPNTTGRSTASWWRVLQTASRHPAGDRQDRGDGPSATAGLPSAWMRTDEWYDFQTNPRTTATVLATVDESSYTGGTMGADHPVVWTHTTTGGGRALYTAMGHTR